MTPSYCGSSAPGFSLPGGRAPFELHGIHNAKSPATFRQRGVLPETRHSKHIRMTTMPTSGEGSVNLLPETA